MAVRFDTCHLPPTRGVFVRAHVVRTIYRWNRYHRLHHTLGGIPGEYGAIDGVF